MYLTAFVEHAMRYLIRFVAAISLLVLLSSCEVIESFVLGADLALGTSAEASTAIDYNNISVTRTDDGAFVLGNPDAKFTLVVFEDYRCSHCINYEPTIIRFLQDYVVTGDAKFEPRMLQTASPDDSVFRIAQCAGEHNPDKFFEYREELFNMTSRGWDAAKSPRKFASKFDLSYSDILSCTNNVTQIATDATLAQKVGATGTPYVMYRDELGNIKLLDIGQAPAYDQLKAFVDSILVLH